MFNPHLVRHVLRPRCIPPHSRIVSAVVKFGKPDTRSTSVRKKKRVTDRSKLLKSVIETPTFIRFDQVSFQSALRLGALAQIVRNRFRAPTLFGGVPLYIYILGGGQKDRPSPPYPGQGLKKKGASTSRVEPAVPHIFPQGEKKRRQPAGIDPGHTSRQCQHVFFLSPYIYIRGVSKRPPIPPLELRNAEDLTHTCISTRGLFFDDLSTPTIVGTRLDGVVRAPASVQLQLQ